MWAKCTGDSESCKHKISLPWCPDTLPLPVACIPLAHPRVRGHQGAPVAIPCCHSHSHSLRRMEDGGWRMEEEGPAGEGQKGVFIYYKNNNYSIKVVMMSIAGLILIKF